MSSKKTENTSNVVPPQPLAVNQAAIQDFIETLWPEGTLSEAGGQLVVWGRSPLRGTTTIWKDSVEAAAVAAAEVAQKGFNTYLGVAAHDYEAAQRGAGPNTRIPRGCNASAIALPGVWVDIDYADGAHKSGNLPPDFDTAAEIVKRLGHYPTMVVATGGGIHAWYCFKEPLLITNDTERSFARSLTKSFSELMKAHAMAIGNYHLDSVEDLARVMRIPGTINRKTGMPERECKFLGFDPDCRYEPGDILDDWCKQHRAYVRSASTSQVVHDLSSYERELIKECIPDLSDHRADDYHAWIKIGFTLKAAGNTEEMRQLWHEFSKRSEKYDPEICNQKWNSFPATGDAKNAFGNLVGWANDDAGSSAKFPNPLGPGRVWPGIDDREPAPAVFDEAFDQVGAESAQSAFEPNFANPEAHAAVEDPEPGFAANASTDSVDEAQQVADETVSSSADSNASGQSAEAQGDAASNQEAACDEDDWIPFPVEHLPPVLRDFALECTKATMIDPAVFVLGSLVICGGAIGNSNHVEIKKDWKQPPLVWGAIVADSAYGKSPAIKLVSAPISALQGRHFHEYAKDKRQYQEEMSAWKVMRKQKKDADAERPSDEPAKPEPRPPTLKHIYIDDSTVEAIGQRLSANPRGLICIKDELAALIKGFNQYKKSGSDKEKYLQLYDASEMKIDRASKEQEPLFIPHAFVSILGGIQPAIMATLLTGEDADCGFTHRWIFVMPPPTEKYFNKYEADRGVMARYEDTVSRLAAVEMPVVDGKQSPRLVRLSAAAQEDYSKFHNEIESRIQKSRGTLIREALPKLRAQAVRLALIFQLVSAASGEKGARNEEVDQKSMRRGIEVARWFIREQGRVYREMTVSEEQRFRETVISMFREAGGQMTQRDYVRKRNVKAETAMKEIAELERCGVVKCYYSSSGARGGAPSRIIRLRENREQRHAS